MLYSPDYSIEVVQTLPPNIPTSISRYYLRVPKWLRDEAQRVGYDRHFAKSDDIRDKRDYLRKEGEPPEWSHVKGVFTELIYADIFNISIDYGIYKHGDDADFFVGRLECKANTFQGRGEYHLRIPCHEYKRKRPDVYTASWLDDRLTKLIWKGSITREDFDKRKEKINYKGLWNWYVPESMLMQALPYYDNITNHMFFIPLV